MYPYVACTTCASLSHKLEKQLSSKQPYLYQHIIYLTELDELPTKNELSTAIDFPKAGKAPGIGGTSAENLNPLIRSLDELLCKC